MWYGHEGADGWGWIWMVIMMAFIGVPLLLGLLWAIRQSAGPNRLVEAANRQPEPDAWEIARRAYARGELDRERYLQVAEDLEVARE